jgi:hypothetical protein
MDQQALTGYLGGKGKDERRIAKAVKTIRKFERYLSRTSKTVDQAAPEDLERFLEQHTQESTTKYDLADLELYYAAKGNSRMQEALAEPRRREPGCQKKPGYHWPTRVCPR